MNAERHPASPAGRSDAERTAAHIMVGAHRMERLAAAHAADSDEAFWPRRAMRDLLAEAPDDDAAAQDSEMWRVCRLAAACWAASASTRTRRRWGHVLRAAADGVIHAEGDAGTPEPDERRRGRDAALPD